MHPESAQLVRAVLALGFAMCVIGYLLTINALRRDMASEGQRTRYYALLAGCFAGAIGTAEQAREGTPLGLRVYATAAFLIVSLVALRQTRRELRQLREREGWQGPPPRRSRS